MTKKATAKAASAGVSASAEEYRAAVRTVPIKDSVRNRSLAEVLSDPLPPPKFNKEKSLDHDNRTQGKDVCGKG